MSIKSPVLHIAATAWLVVASGCSPNEDPVANSNQACAIHRLEASAGCHANDRANLTFTGKVDFTENLPAVVTIKEGSTSEVAIGTLTNPTYQNGLWWFDNFTLTSGPLSLSSGNHTFNVFLRQYRNGSVVNTLSKVLTVSVAPCVFAPAVAAAASCPTGTMQPQVTVSGGRLTTSSDAPVDWELELDGLIVTAASAVVPVTEGSAFVVMVPLTEFDLTGAGEHEVKLCFTQAPDFVAVGCDTQTVTGFDLSDSPTDCGECGHVCPPDASTCENGLCRPACDSTCATGMEGSCAIGTWICGGAGGGTCVPPNQGAPEICDGQDNDCDGEVDNGSPSALCTGGKICCPSGQCMSHSCDGGGCVDVDLGNAADYNLFVLGELVHRGGDSEGAVAAGSAVLEDFGIGLNVAHNVPGLVVEGGLSWTRIQVSHGDAWIGGILSPAPTITAPLPVPDGTLHADGQLPSGFPSMTQMRSELQQLSATIANLPTTGTASLSDGPQWRRLTLVASVDAAPSVVNLDRTTWLAANEVQLDVPAGASLIVNVLGVSSDSMGGSGRPFGAMWVSGSARRVLWNFVDTTSLRLANLGWMGTILAPLADVHYDSGEINGQLIASSVHAETWSAEVHDFRFVSGLQVCE